MRNFPIMFPLELTDAVVMFGRFVVMGHGEDIVLNFLVG